MEISGKVLREVEFRDRLRGYDTDEVDEFLEQAAVAVDDLHAQLAKAATRSPASSADDDIPVFDDGSIRRTLVLAQRTADLAVSEAREEAQRIVEEARRESDTILDQARESVRALREEAEESLSARVDALESERARLEEEASSLAVLLASERERLTQGLGAALRFVEETLAIPSELAHVVDKSARRSGGPTRSSHAPRTTRTDRSMFPEALPGFDAISPLDDLAPDPHVVIPDVESEISEDAATAGGLAVPAVQRPVDDDSDSGGGDGASAETRDLGGDAPISSLDDAGRLDFSNTTPPPALDADEALWAEWAAGGAVRGTAPAPVREMLSEPLRFDRRPGGGRSA